MFLKVFDEIVFTQFIFKIYLIKLEKFTNHISK